MNPYLLLTLWRERWGKTAEASFRTAYVLGKPNTVGTHLVYAKAWTVFGVSSGVLIACAALFAWMLSIRFSLGGQVAFSLLITGFALYLQRYKGTLVTLTLFCLSVLVSARYLGWRFANTLGHTFDFDFLLALGLFAAELHLWMLGVLGFINKLWPLKQKTAPLPDSQSNWPSVDVYLPIGDCEADTALQFCLNALSLDWPKGKLQVFLVDGANRPMFQKIAASARVGYIASTIPATSAAETLHLALNQTSAEFVAIFDGNAVPEKNFLQASIGWFKKEPALGILQTVKNAALSESSLSAIQCTLLRRSLAVEAGEPEPGSSSTYSTIASRLRSQGYRSGDIGFDSSLAAGVKIHRIDHSAAGSVPGWKVWSAQAQAMLQFYLPVTLLIFLTAPAVYLLGGVRLVHSGLDWFAAYAIPHLLNQHIVETRLRRPGRLPAWIDLRDTLLAWYLPFPTVIAVLRTKFNELRKQFETRLFKAGSGGRTGQNERSMEEFHWTSRLAFAAILALNLLGLLCGAVASNWSDIFELTDSTAYFLWGVLNLALLIATFGIAEEGRHIRRHKESLARLRSMVRTPSGHTIRCITENFPSTALTLSLPASLPLDVASKVDVSIFFDQHEFSFPANVEKLDQDLLHVRIDETAWERYQLAANAIFARGPEWPKWLPGPNADSPFPRWLTTGLSSGVGATIALIQRIGTTLQLARLLRWIEKRKNAT